MRAQIRCVFQTYAGIIALPSTLALPPYTLNEAFIGLATIPVGVG